MNYADILRESVNDDDCPLDQSILQNPIFLTKLASGFIQSSEGIIHMKDKFEKAANAIMELSLALDFGGFKANGNSC